MDKSRYGTTTVLSFVFGLLTILDYVQTASVRNKDDVFSINITMPNFNTTQVQLKHTNHHLCIKKKILFNYRKINILFFNMNYLTRN